VYKRQSHIAELQRCTFRANSHVNLQNFIVCVLDAQFKHDNLESFDALVLRINYFFSGIFAVELVINLFANWMDAFIRNGWNWLDVVIVLLSFIDFGSLSIPDSLVRLMRALRVVRLFGRVRELTKIFSAITASLFPMMNAFVILIIVLSICESADPTAFRPPRPLLPHQPPSHHISHSVNPGLPSAQSAVAILGESRLVFPSWYSLWFPNQHPKAHTGTNQSNPRKVYERVGMVPMEEAGALAWASAGPH
jgi:hypothetical protein